VRLGLPFLGATHSHKLLDFWHWILLASILASSRLRLLFFCNTDQNTHPPDSKTSVGGAMIPASLATMLSGISSDQGGKVSRLGKVLWRSVV
jgi:hypothetical protein